MILSQTQLEQLLSDHVGMNTLGVSTSVNPDFRYVKKVGPYLIGFTKADRKMVDYCCSLQAEYDINHVRYITGQQRCGILLHKIEQLSPLQPVVDLARVNQTIERKWQWIQSSPFHELSLKDVAAWEQASTTCSAVLRLNYDNPLEHRLVLHCVVCRADVPKHALKVCLACQAHLPLCAERSCWKRYWKMIHRTVCQTEQMRYWPYDSTCPGGSSSSAGDGSQSDPYPVTLLTRERSSLASAYALAP